MPGTPGDERGWEPDEDLGELWRWGLEASQQMGERLVDLYRQVGTAATVGLGRDLDEELRRARIDMERWVDLSFAVFDRASAIMQRLAADGDGAGVPAERVSLEGHAGEPCSGFLWVHNLADDERVAPGLRCPGLTAVGGDRIAGERVCFEGDPEPLPGRTSRKVSVVVDVPESAPLGIYHGQILSDASPEHAVPICVEVRLPEPGADA